MSGSTRMARGDAGWERGLKTDETLGRGPGKGPFVYQLTAEATFVPRVVELSQEQLSANAESWKFEFGQA
jgi:hypothetical protein